MPEFGQELMNDFEEVNEKLKETAETLQAKLEQALDEARDNYKVMIEEELAQFIEALVVERNYQLGKYGDDFDAKNTRNDWIAYLGNYLRPIFTAETPEEIQKAFVSVGALCAAGYEWSIRGMAKRHYD